MHQGEKTKEKTKWRVVIAERREARKNKTFQNPGPRFCVPVGTRSCGTISCFQILLVSRGEREREKSKTKKAMEEKFLSSTTGIYVLRQTFKVSDPILTGRAQQKRKQTAMEEKNCAGEAKTAIPNCRIQPGL